MVYCVAYGCHNDSKYTKGVSYYRLMSQPPFTRAAWLEKLNANKSVSITSNSVVCSNHFENDCFVRDLRSELMGCRPRRYLRKGSVPTIFTIPDGTEGNPTKRKRGRKKGVSINKKSKSEISNDEGPRCDFCLLTSASNVFGAQEELLACKDCNAKAHPSCMDYTPILAERSRLFPWQCIDCKTCTMCEDSGDAGTMLFCDACDRGFHMECHIPQIKTKPIGNWMCSFCAKETGNEQNSDKEQEKLQYLSTNQTNGTANGLNGAFDCSDPLLYLSKDITSSTNNRKRNSLLSSNAEDWTVDEVVKYFITAGFPDEALAFREQEIDGRSLLLMKRSDVLTGLSIRLGPALKIYNHVKRLQLCETDDCSKQN